MDFGDRDFWEQFRISSLGSILLRNAYFLLPFKALHVGLYSQQGSDKTQLAESV
jgi:hypothetical protein